MDKGDILVLVYPNLNQVEGVVIVDPYDKKAKYYRATSVEEVKNILNKNLPFCNQGHEPIIHYGEAFVYTWESLTLPSETLKIKRPDDIDELSNGNNRCNRCNHDITDTNTNNT
jgi:hypothetical protein